jgi:3-oxoisoapionate decarboxylase
MKLGVGSYTFTWAAGVPGHEPERPLTVWGLVDRAAQLGVRVVQVCENLPLGALSVAELDALKARVRELGMELEVGTRGLEAENLGVYLGLAQRFGASFVRVVMDRAGDEPSAVEAVERLRAVRGSFRAAGMRLAIENHDRFSAAVLREMVEALGTDWAGICLDTVNSFGALEGPGVVVRELARHTLSLHIKDFTIRRVPSQMGFVVEGCPAGEGRLDVGWLLGELCRAGREVNAVVELWTPWMGSLDETIRRESEWAEASVGRMREWIPD